MVDPEVASSLPWSQRSCMPRQHDPAQVQRLPVIRKRQAIPPKHRADTATSLGQGCRADRASGGRWGHRTQVSFEWVCRMANSPSQERSASMERHKAQHILYHVCRNLVPRTTLPPGITTSSDVRGSAPDTRHSVRPRK